METLQERLGLKRPAAVAVIAATGCGAACSFRVLCLAGWMWYPSISVRWGPCSPVSCSSGLLERTSVDHSDPWKRKKIETGLFPWKVCAGTSRICGTSGRCADGWNRLKYIKTVFQFFARTVLIHNKKFTQLLQGSNQKKNKRKTVLHVTGNGSLFHYVHLIPSRRKGAAKQPSTELTGGNWQNY